MTRQHSERFHTFNLLNMALGALAFAVTVYLMITGEYDSLLLRQHAEALLSKLEVGALLYVALFWYLDRFLLPQWFGTSAQMH